MFSESHFNDYSLLVTQGGSRPPHTIDFLTEPNHFTLSHYGVPVPCPTLNTIVLQGLGLAACWALPDWIPTSYISSAELAHTSMNILIYSRILRCPNYIFLYYLCWNSPYHTSGRYIPCHHCTSRYDSSFMDVYPF